MEDVDDEVAFITGGASGMGRNDLFSITHPWFLEGSKARCDTLMRGEGTC